MDPFTIRDLPTSSAFLAGRGPVDPAVGVVTERLQVFWRLADLRDGEARLHAHTRGDELFVVLSGFLVVEVGGAEHVVGPRQWCHFDVGVFHRIVRAEGSLEALVLRAPSVDDKAYA